MDDKKLGSNKILKILATVILVIFVIILVIVMSVYSVFYGIIEKTMEAVQEAWSDIGDGVKAGINWLGISRVKEGLPIFLVSKEQINALETKLKNNGISPETCGLTDVRLRKMLLTYSVSSSLSDTLCIAEISEEEIINNFKICNSEYKNNKGLTINDVWDLGHYDTEDSKDRWNFDGFNYTLYLEKNADKSNSDNFFYFYDENAKFDDDAKWYIGSMGVTTITTSDGETLQYYSESGFAALKNEFQSQVESCLLDPLNTDTYKNIQKAYTKKNADNGNVITLYQTEVNQNKYYYHFNNAKNDISIENPEQEDGEEFKYNLDADSTYQLKEQNVDLSTEIDLSRYAISIELMMDLLDMTSSGQFLETFIDFALEKTSTSVNAYSLTTENITYNKTTYNINPNNFIVEVYDMDDTNGFEITEDGAVLSDSSKGDNFRAYYDIIYNRKYNGGNIGSVVNIPDYMDIKYGEDDYLNPQGDNCYAKKLNEYLKNAYDPGDDFEIGNINVEEVIVNTKSSNIWNFNVEEVETWYGTFKYPSVEVKNEYSINDSESDESTYNEYNQTKMTDYTDETGTTIEKRYINNKLIQQVNRSYLTATSEEQKSKDISDDPMETVDGRDNRPHFTNWTMKGLFQIAENDDGEKNDELGIGVGCDYVYTRYTTTNVKKYKPITKINTQYINQSNITEMTTLNDTEARLLEFLALLRNNRGAIPGSVHADGSEYFTERGDDPSIVVKYGDIYEGDILAGDLLLDNGARMLFELLEMSENTQNLVNVFKYLAWRYTGVDYGVTDVNQIVNSFTFDYSYCNDPLLEYFQSWENSYIKNYIDGIGNYSVASKYITEDKSKYIVYWESSSNTWNFSYGLNITGGGYDQSFTNNGLENPSTYMKTGATADVEKLDAVFKDKISEFRQRVINITSGYNLSDTQIDALTAVMYQYGNIDGFKTTYSEDLTTFKNKFWVNTASGGKAKPFVSGQPQKRADANWKLYSEGIYVDSNGKTISNLASGDITTIAGTVHDYVRTNGYSYGHSSGIRSAGGTVSVSKMTQQKEVNCISYCTWVYAQAGYIDEVWFACTDFNTAATSGKYKNKFVQINSYSDMQPGDIMFINNNSNYSQSSIDHAEIYMGPGLSYNCRNKCSNSDNLIEMGSFI